MHEVIMTFVVGVAGFEPTTSSSRTTRATGLRYTPIICKDGISKGLYILTGFSRQKYQKFMNF